MTNPKQTKKQFLSAVEAVVARELGRAGFEERSDGGFTCDLPRSVEATGYVGLNRGTTDSNGGHDLHVLVGVEHSSLRDLYSELVPDETPFGGVITNLARLMPQPNSDYWSFDPGADNEETAALLADSVVRYGKPFMSDLADLKDLAKHIVDNEPDNTRSYRVPPALLILGKPDEARRIVDRELESLEDDTSWSTFYATFASRFLDRLHMDANT